MGADPSLPTLLSQPLVAFTIEFDNEFEHRLTHRTTWGPAARSRRGPWLVSQVMWANFMRFVGENGVPLRELDGLARITNLAGLERWGYVTVGPDPADGRAAPPRRDWVIRPTPAGRRAQTVWAPLAGVVEDRWRDRFGADQISALRDALQALVTRLDPALPPYLPVLRHELFTEVAHFRPRAPAVAGPRTDLSMLLSRVLLAFALDFERDAAVSLAVGANALRVLTGEGVPVRDLPRLTGVSKEALSMALGVLARRGHAVIEPDPAGRRVKRARLTPKGRSAQDDHRRLLDTVEQRWRTRFGSEPIGALRRSLHALIGQRDGGQPRMSQGLQPYPDGWRANKPYLRQTTAVLKDPGGALPRYPMVLHRGGWPDGS